MSKSTKEIIESIDKNSKEIIITILTNQLNFNKDLCERSECNAGLQYAIDMIKEL